MKKIISFFLVSLLIGINISSAQEIFDASLCNYSLNISSDSFVNSKSKYSFPNCKMIDTITAYSLENDEPIFDSIVLLHDEKMFIEIISKSSLNNFNGNFLYCLNTSSKKKVIIKRAVIELVTPNKIFQLIQTNDKMDFDLQKCNDLVTQDGKSHFVIKNIIFEENQKLFYLGETIDFIIY